MSNKRLEKILIEWGGQLEDGDLLDCYNHTFVRDVSYTILTKISTASHYYVVEIKDTTSN